MKTDRTGKKRRAATRRHGGGRVAGRRDVPGIALSIRGIPEIHRALRERYGFAPSLSSIYEVLRGEKENEALVRTVAEMFPAAILPAVAAKYGIAATPGEAENAPEAGK